MINSIEFTKELNDKNPRVTDKHQIIIATHSAFALSKNPDYNLIEMSDGYVSEYIEAYKTIITRL